MALWTKLKTELNRAGRAAQGALDEGRLRLDVVRSRQAMDKAAQKVGYAVYRARKDGGDIAADEYARLSADVANAEAEITRLETLIKEAAVRRKEGPSGPAAGDTPPAA